MRRRHWEQGQSLRELAAAYGVNKTTIQRWVHRENPHDRSSAPHQPARRIDAELAQAAIAHRQAHPQHGPLRIAQKLGWQGFAVVAASSIWRLLRQRQLIGPRPARVRTPKPIPVGHHRVQMDLQ